MAEGAKVTSTDAIEAFRSSLVIYLTKAQRALDEASDEVRRTKLWLQGEQRVHLERQVKKLSRKKEQAEQELMSARMSNLRDDISAQQMAFNKAKRALVEAEEKYRTLKRWNRDFESRVAPALKRLDGLHHILAHDLPKGVGILAEIIKTLEAYAETGPPAASAPPPPPPTED